jgi:molybdate transport system substrate-binding protein
MPQTRRRMTRILGAFAAALLLSTSACGAETPKGAVSSHVTITVFAAASLKGTFTEIGEQFESENDGVTVKLNFAGSSDLVAQLEQGAPADVFASADTKNMVKAINDDLVTGTPVGFASNTLEIATPPDNPAGIDSLDDLTNPGVKVVLCAAEVPCGDAAHRVARAEHITIEPVSEEQSVTDVLGKVISGEADAGLVYVTDVKAAGKKVHGVEFPESSKAVNTYPIAAMSHSRNVEVAKAFVEFVSSPEGQAILAAAGFAKP